MKNRSHVMILTAALSIGAALWFPGLWSRRVAAQSAGLMGSYGFLVTDLNNPSATLGKITFDGAGNVTSSATIVQPDPNAATAQVLTGQVTGTYTVNADGTGTMTLMGRAAPTINSFVITDGGAVVMFVETAGSGNDVVTGMARKQ